MTLHRKTWEAAREHFAKLAEGWGLVGDFGQLASAIRSSKPPRASTKSTRSRAKRATEKRARRATKAQVTARIRAAVFYRAGERPGEGSAICEMCRLAIATEMHHAFGRIRVAQSERNCIAACHSCHESVTNPTDAVEAWVRVADVFHRLGYNDEAARADKEAQWHTDKAKASEQMVDRLRKAAAL